MRSQIVAFAASVPLMLSAGGAFAGEGSGGRDPSALIGSGHAASTVQSAVVTGSPGSVHWSALIGGGHAGVEAVQRPQVSVNTTASLAAHAHWSSRIGTARAVDADTRS